MTHGQDAFRSASVAVGCPADTPGGPRWQHVPQVFSRKKHRCWQRPGGATTRGTPTTPTALPPLSPKRTRPQTPHPDDCLQTRRIAACPAQRCPYPAHAPPVRSRPASGPAPILPSPAQSCPTLPQRDQYSGQTFPAVDICPHAPFHALPHIPPAMPPTAPGMHQSVAYYYWYNLQYSQTHNTQSTTKIKFTVQHYTINNTKYKRGITHTSWRA